MANVQQTSNGWPDQTELWDRKFERKLQLGNYATNPFPLAVSKLSWLVSSNVKTLLELGCGLGNDALFFAENGLEVTAIDFSEVALWAAKARVTQASLTNIQFALMDLRKPLGFRDSVFDAVYVHLSLHYFGHRTTARVFTDIHRVLRGRGTLILSVKSVYDSLYGKGIKLADNIYNYKGHIRHFFSESYLRNNMSFFAVVELARHEDFYDGHLSSFYWTVGVKR